MQDFDDFNNFDDFLKSRTIHIRGKYLHLL